MGKHFRFRRVLKFVYGDFRADGDDAWHMVRLEDKPSWVFVEKKKLSQLLRQSTLTGNYSDALSLYLSVSFSKIQGHASLVAAEMNPVPISIIFKVLLNSVTTFISLLFFLLTFCNGLKEKDFVFGDPPGRRLLHQSCNYVSSEAVCIENTDSLNQRKAKYRH